MIGHNNPPNPIDAALVDFGDAIEETNAWLDGTKVETEGQMNAVDTLIKQIKAAKKAVEEAEESAVRPFYDQWKAGKATFKPTFDDLDLRIKGLVSIVADFKKRLAAEKAEAAAALQRKAWADADAARAAARVASAGDIEAQREVLAMEQAAELALAEASAASKDTVRGLRSVTKHEVLDMRALVNWIATNDKDAMAAFATEYARKNHADIPNAVVRSWVEKEAF